MRVTGILVLIICGIWLAGACAKQDVAPSSTDLTGTWRVTKAEYVSTQGLGTVDLIAGGGSGTLVLGAGNSFQLNITPASGAPVNLAATYQVNGIDLMQVTPAGATWYWAFDMALSGSSLTLNHGSAQYDFNHDGQLEAATWNLTMAR